jgi:ABC-type phosphate transport system auxiliary subunit
MSSIHYIGHGRLESSPENFSILHVVAHELSHVQEFKNEAFRENADIAEIRVKIDYEMRPNGKMVAVSGETTAITQKKNESDSNNSLFEPYTKEKKNSDSSINESKEEKSDENKASQEKMKELNLISRKDKLEAKLAKVESELNNLDEKFLENLDMKKQELSREKRKVEEELRLLKMEEETKKNFEFLSEAQKEKVKNAFAIGKNATSGELLYTQA